MSYERDCELYALCGDPAREELEAEYNARFDYMREAFGDTALDSQVEDEYYDAGLVEPCHDHPMVPLGPPRPGDLPLCDEDIPF